jgi:aryl-alcohol dehydrogenase-like predicted oxidoreductase
MRSCAREGSATSRPRTTPSRVSPKPWLFRAVWASPDTVALQPHYNLVHRAEYEGGLAALCAHEGLACFPYPALASGFLSGKYRSGAKVESARASGAAKYLDDKGLRILATLDAIAEERRMTVATVSLAWLLTRPAVVAPIASARTPEQLADLLPVVPVYLTDDEQKRLNDASV